MTNQSPSPLGGEGLGVGIFFSAPGSIFTHDGTVYEVITSRPVGNRGWNITARPICDGWRTTYTYLFFVNTKGEIRS